MPRGDGTGPMGMGPMTGRAAGFCAGYHMPGYANPAFGPGCGMGRGWRRQFYATGLPYWARFGRYPGYSPDLTPDQEKIFLKKQAEVLQSQIDAITKRLEEIEAEEKKAK